eukprot:CAMPEP_0201956528 /NCGR_PEP_ID=MMETSP0904-20121228/3961_1 /ASSEMBLY_ACC=CAM_ASM_000553 /TAXON_ID=420261 /ORGANISM="Thalassiosira antarctica, Strain CCMP982" /LENGTH=280 /DNA_ID=CAMNT_0048501117 /DNA_START=109 /DNA_END=951 /DNA_ORIENTATION=+
MTFLLLKLTAFALAASSGVWAHDEPSTFLRGSGLVDSADNFDEADLFSGCIPTGALARRSRGQLSMRDVCDRSFGVLGLTEPYTCETGAKFACCPSSTARSVNIPSLGRCTKGRGDDLEDEKEIDAHEEITNESIDELEEDEFDEMDESDFSEDVMGQEDKNNDKKNKKNKKKKNNSNKSKKKNNNKKNENNSNKSKKNHNNKNNNNKNHNNKTHNNKSQNNNKNCPKPLEGQYKPSCAGGKGHKVCCNNNNDRVSWWQCGGTNCSSEDEKKMGTVVRVA